MIYNSKRHIPPKNNGLTDHVRRMSRAYESTAQKQALNAIEASSFEIMLFKIKTVGKKCTCRKDYRNEILNSDGNMTEESMNQIISRTASVNPISLSINSSALLNPMVVSVSEYNPKTVISEARKVEKLVVKQNEIDEDENDDDIDEPDSEDIELLEQFDREYGRNDNYLSAITSNCPLCSRTGFVGGFNLFNGVRNVYDVQCFDDVKFANLNFETSPNQLESLYSEDSNEMASFRIKDILPSSIWKVITFRLMNGWEEVTDFELYVVDSTNFIKINTNLDLKNWCNGTPVEFEIRFAGTVTHLEFMFQTTNNPLFVDITTWNRTSSSKRINDLDAIQFNLPAIVGTIRKGDLFFEKESRALWVITQVEVQRSAHTVHGFTGSAERVKSMYEPYSLFNPYQMSRGEVV